MLDLGLHQGTSLYGRMPEDGLRMVTVACAPGGHSLELLWSLCMHWQRLGYPPVVLDGSASESAEAPGLIDLLEHCLPIEAPRAGHAGEHSLAVLPAAHGLAVLAEPTPSGVAPLYRLQPLLRRYAVVVLYAPVPVLASGLMAEISAPPLLLLETGPGAVMATYADLKRLALHANLNGTVLRLAYGQHQRAAAHQQLRTLCECAARHLGRTPRTLALDPEHTADLQRLALELLENAQILPAGAPPALPSSRDAVRASHHATSH